MKTTNYLYPALFMFLFIWLSASCSSGDEGDTTRPVIHLVEPEEGAALEVGNEHGVHFDLELSDDVLLKSYKVDIHPNFDGHAHKSTPASDAEDAAENFFFTKAWDLPAQRNVDVHHHEIRIPANATPGNYHLMVYCTDAAGNEAQLARNIVLSLEGGDHEDHHDE
jgi:hypothetical protein